jgi:hypothetical protein
MERGEGRKGEMDGGRDGVRRRAGSCLGESPVSWRYWILVGGH